MVAAVRGDVQRMEWADGLALDAGPLALVGVYAAALAALVPALAAHRSLVGPALVAMTATGTVVYVTHGLPLSAPCRACGERSHLGALRCARTGAVRAAVARPLVQAVLTIGLFVAVGVVAGSARTILPWLVGHGVAGHGVVGHGTPGPGAAGDPLFRSAILGAAMVASVPVPVVAGNLLRLALRR